MDDSYVEWLFLTEVLLRALYRLLFSKTPIPCMWFVAEFLWQLVRNFFYITSRLKKKIN